MPEIPTHDKFTLVQKMAWCIRHQAITCDNIDSDLCNHMALPGHNKVNTANILTIYHRSKSLFGNVLAKYINILWSNFAAVVVKFHLAKCFHFIGELLFCIFITSHSRDTRIVRNLPKSVITGNKLQYIPRNMHTVLLCFALLLLCNR